MFSIFDYGDGSFIGTAKTETNMLLFVSALINSRDDVDSYQVTHFNPLIPSLGGIVYVHNHQEKIDRRLKRSNEERAWKNARLTV